MWGAQDMVRQPCSCPVCGRPKLRPLFEDVRITAEIDHEFRQVGGLAAFMCTDFSHIFFVLKKDMEHSEPAQGMATES